jgi:N-acetylglucosaminyldiphosphoundecaprenol N-acetyl-beta-D-mannosaminyltransferase
MDGIPGYICVCDSSVMARIHKDKEYRELINGAFVNTCDGSSICSMSKMLYGGTPESVNGPELFEKYTQDLRYKQLIIGNTESIVQMVRDKIRSNGVTDNHIDHLQVPFCKVEEFDYKGIADEINAKEYDIVWVSLGNPKQEIFMRNIQPYLNKGVMFGIGAALNFWVGDLALPKFHIGPLRFIWLTRIFQDPKRKIKMNWEVIKSLPGMYMEEKKKKNHV